MNDSDTSPVSVQEVLAREPYDHSRRSTPIANSIWNAGLILLIIILLLLLTAQLTQFLELLHAQSEFPDRLAIRAIFAAALLLVHAYHGAARWMAQRRADSS